MDLSKKIAVLVILLTIGISVKIIIDQERSTDLPDISGQSSSWLYRRGIEIENDMEMTMFEKEITLTINTQELIKVGKLQPDCSDIRFLDEDHATKIEYKIEQDDITHGCNSEETKIHLTVTSISPEGKTIYFLYGNTSAPAFN
jgi:hypothetical protein